MYSTLLPLQQCVGLTVGTERAALRRNQALGKSLAAQGVRAVAADLVAKEPDLTLEEIRDRLRREKKVAVATSSVWRFYDRHEITFKKSPARG